MRGVVTRYEGALVRYGARITGDLERARDVVQSTFMALHTAGGRPGSDKAADFAGPGEADAAGSDTARPAAAEFLGEPHLGQWLFTVCRNRALDVRRKESRMNLLSEADGDGCASREQSPVDVAEGRETLEKVLALLGTLPNNQQECLRLKFQNGFSYRQISGITNLSVSNVGYLIHMGLKTLRSKLTGPLALEM